MDESTRRRIVQKASYVRDAVEVLASKRDSLTFEEYRDRRQERDVVEREFQTAIEACIDIGEMLLRSHGGAVPDTNAAVFRELASSGTITDETADRMARAAGLRNVLSHQYGPISTIETSSTVCGINSTRSRNTSRKSDHRSSKSVDRTITL